MEVAAAVAGAVVMLVVAIVVRGKVEEAVVAV